MARLCCAEERAWWRLCCDAPTGAQDGHGFKEFCPVAKDTLQANGSSNAELQAARGREHTRSIASTSDSARTARNLNSTSFRLRTPMEGSMNLFSAANYAEHSRQAPTVRPPLYPAARRAGWLAAHLGLEVLAVLLPLVVVGFTRREAPGGTGTPLRNPAAHGPGGTAPAQLRGAARAHPRATRPDRLARPRSQHMAWRQPGRRARAAGKGVCPQHAARQQNQHVFSFFQYCEQQPVHGSMPIPPVRPQRVLGPRLLPQSWRAAQRGPLGLWQVSCGALPGCEWTWCLCHDLVDLSCFEVPTRRGNQLLL